MRVKIGAFGKLGNLADIVNAGYDVAELDAVEIAELEDHDFAKFKNTALNSPISMDVFASALPYDRPIVGHDFNRLEFREFVKKSCFRLGQLDAKMLIMGNGKARSMPSVDRQAAEERFDERMIDLCEAAADNQISVLLEPLGPLYSNYINTIVQAVTICGRLKQKNLFAMCDLRHMVSSGDSFDHIVNFSEFIRHVHIDNPTIYPERRYPKSTDAYDYAPYFDALKKIDYSGTITIEAQIPEDFAEEFRQVKSFFSNYGVYPY